MLRVSVKGLPFTVEFEALDYTPTHIILLHELRANAPKLRLLAHAKGKSVSVPAGVLNLDREELEHLNMGKLIGTIL